ncbi:hypothetical protein DKX38_023452 [Salix brachista]|uniref:Uncharacterized protein n=1 Tax=Salix brachista TaxID=2182728 RepID=A0A5N5JPA3_9ROSI|nr:hypothetical protein DKX38_023452 [Salix brachista]
MLAPFTAGWQSNDLDPLVIEKSEGSYVYDINGKKYLDALAGLWCTSLGGNKPRLVASATEQLNRLPFYHSFWNRTTKPSLDLAKELLETLTASKMAKAFLQIVDPKPMTPRYHGSTLIAASLPGDKFNIKPELVSVVEERPFPLVTCQLQLALSLMDSLTLATLERNILDQVNRIAPKFQDGVKAFSDSPIIGEIRGTGLILGTEFVDNNSPNDPFPPEWGVGAYFGAQCEKEGMLVRVAGDNIMMCPPFIMSPEEVGELISKHGKALRATEERVKELKSQHKKQ